MFSRKMPSQYQGFLLRTGPKWSFTPSGPAHASHLRSHAPYERNTHMFRFKHPSVPNTRSEQKPQQSNRSTTPGGASWKKALAISALPLAFIFGAAFQLPNNVSAQLTAIQFQID